ncbi:MAG: class I SAM-dependent rRNA methyltransferase [Firmicutes bacterium]|nr:class I SAM-dependent rRNA methyltransferase [Bacillota bacterium]
MDRPYAKVIVNEKAERSLRQGHPWVYGAEVIEREGEAQNGDMVDVYSKKRRWLGAGFLNDRSKILVRLISQNANDSFDAAFFRRRLRHAVDFRAAVMGDDFDACRLIFGEADFFPGWTVDRYGDILVSEVLSLGVDCRRELLYSLLLEVLAERGVKICAVYERNEAALRDKEGLPKYKGFLDLPGLACDLDGHVEICENGIYYDVDYINGQKTGFFLDQKYNRRAAARLAPGRRVLDCCTHTGAFALNAAKACAASVTAVDVSADALALARRNAAMNGLEDKIDFLCADVFDLLTRLVEEKSHDFDYVILDPPAFTKSGATVSAAFRGYKEINLKAMRLLPRGGFLATCSCSHFMTDDLFREMLKEAAADAGVRLRQIERRQQGPDHPILWGVPETNYLKFYLLQIA